MTYKRLVSIVECILFVLTGDSFGAFMNDVGKAALLPLGIPEAFLMEYRASMSVIGKYGCGHIAGIFSPPYDGPSILHLYITGKFLWNYIIKSC